MKKCFGYFFVFILFISTTPVFLSAQEPEFPPPAIRTVVADVLDVEGDFIIVRGERGEIRIEVKPDTEISEEFQYGDRVKAVLKPNDSAISVVRAGKDEPVGITANTSETIPQKVKPTAQKPSGQKSAEKTDLPPTPTGPKTRIIVADLLMVDGDFYVVRSDYGEIRIEATPDTKVTEKFDFGDRIKATVLPNDRATFIERAKPEDIVGIQTLEPSSPAPSEPATPTPTPQASVKPAEQPTPKLVAPTAPKNTRTIVAEVLMIDGDFIIVRGERGEIQIEVTPDTKLSEKFRFGDKIKATVLANDRALSVQRAKPEEPIGITKN